MTDQAEDIQDNEEETVKSVFDASNIFSIDLSDGSTLIGYYNQKVSEKTGLMVVEKPCRILTHMVNDQDVKLGLARYNQLGDNDMVKLNPKHIISYNEATLEGKKMFLEAVRIDYKSDTSVSEETSEFDEDLLCKINYFYENETVH